MAVANPLADLSVTISPLYPLIRKSGVPPTPNETIGSFIIAYIYNQLLKEKHQKHSHICFNFFHFPSC
jgi:pyrrolidone-carboxylate peptidase